MLLFHYEVLLRCWGSKFFSALGRGRVDDGDTDCPAGLVAEGSRLWKRRSQKESQAWLTLCWRNEAPNEKRGHEQSCWEGWRATALWQVFSVMSTDLKYGLYEPRWPDWLVFRGSPRFFSVNPVVRQKCPPLSIKITTATLSCIPVIIIFVVVNPIKMFSNLVH